MALKNTLNHFLSHYIVSHNPTLSSHSSLWISLADIAVVDFASHVKELHKDDDTDFESEYRSIKDGNHSWNVAQLPQNKFKKNRFTNIFPCKQ